MRLLYVKNEKKENQQTDQAKNNLFCMYAKNRSNACMHVCVCVFVTNLLEPTNNITWLQVWMNTKCVTTAMMIHWKWDDAIGSGMEEWTEEYAAFNSINNSAAEKFFFASMMKKTKTHLVCEKKM